MSLLPTQGHGHVWIENGKNAVREIYAFADSVTKGTPPLAHILRTTIGQSDVTLVWKAEVPVIRAQFWYSRELVPTIQIAGEARKDWEKVSYQVDEVALPPVVELPDGSMQATWSLPADMKVGCVNLIDERNLTVSCTLLDLQP